MLAEPRPRVVHEWLLPCPVSAISVVYAGRTFVAEAESIPLPLLGLLNTCRADTPRPTPRLAQVCGSALFCLRRFASAAQAYGAAVRLAAPGTTAGLQDALADCHRRLDVALRRAILEEDHEGFDAILSSGQARRCASGIGRGGAGQG